jgi:hypothetical protein
MDFTGVLTSSNNSLNNLGNQTTTPETIKILNQDQTILGYIYSDYDQANKYSAQVMTNQQQMNDIVSTELTRLNEKKQSIDNALSTRERVSQLNDSYRQRYMQYTKMIAVFILALVCFILINLLGKFLPIIPSIVIDISNVVILCATCIILYNIYANIQSRNKLYFDRLNLDPPTIITPDQAAQNKKSAGLSGNLLGSVNLGGCIGKDCCSAGTYWDLSSSTCLPGTDPSANSFTTLTYAYPKQTIFSPAANSPNEFSEYTIIRP